jgi:signal peptidase I
VEKVPFIGNGFTGLPRLDRSFGGGHRLLDCDGTSPCVSALPFPAQAKMFGPFSSKNREDAKVELARLQAEFEKLPAIEKRTRLFRIAAGRETVEALAVAIILALLFRVFLAEAFVIPTGSMAPTLMGAHKDIFCSRCECRFQIGASIEREYAPAKTVVGGVCPNCRTMNCLDLANNPNHGTFNGDRIVVNRFQYALSDPRRWDVVVFKYPGNPKQNYIKRLVGIPNETLTIRHGDVYARPTGDSKAKDTVLRKSPSKVLSMSHLVHDTNFQSKELSASNYPDRWQPWEIGAETPPTDSWQVKYDAIGLRATVQAGEAEKWIRYHHRWPSETQWQDIEAGKPVTVNPYSSRAITDFYSYAEVSVNPGFVYAEAPLPNSGTRIERFLNNGYSRGEFSPRYQSGGPITQFQGVADQLLYNDRSSVLGMRDGNHWVGDLIVSTKIETDEQAKTITLELVRAGIQYQCRFDLVSGMATLRILDGDRELTFAQAQPKAQTDVYAGGRHEIRMSNFDQELQVWVDGDVVAFDTPTTYEAGEFRSVDQDRPHWTIGHPLDAAPVGIAVQGGSATIDWLQVQRDQYYIAVKSTMGGMNDYQNYSQVTGQRPSAEKMQALMGRPQEWQDFDWTVRQSVTFELKEDQYFPMGDNSPGSLDARSWVGKAPPPMPDDVIKDAWKWRDVNYVPRDLMVGKAVAVFWPHSWNKPLFWPNFSRMELIR